MIKKIINKLRGVSSEEFQRKLLIEKGMKVGKNTNIYSYTGIDPGLPWLISIGDNTTISSNVTILTHDASTCKIGGTKLGKVSIGNNVFIGTRSIVLCNVCIGDNVIVGAGSVVSKDLPANAVYAGQPAKKICSIDAYRDKYLSLRKERPDFSKIRSWDTWKDATEEEKEIMTKALEDGVGFF